MIAVFGVSTLVPQTNYKVARAKQGYLKSINFCARCKFINSCGIIFVHQQHLNLSLRLLLKINNLLITSCTEKSNLLN